MKIYTQDEYIISFGNGPGGQEITQEEFAALLSALERKPSATETIDYRLKTDLTWEEYEIEPEPYEPTDEDKAEAYDILTGGSE